MSIQYRPAIMLPDGVRHHADVVREIEKSEGLKSTGWHYGFKPSAEEVAYKARVHEQCAPSQLTVRHIDTGERRPGHDAGGWTIFRLSTQPKEPSNGNAGCDLSGVDWAQWETDKGLS